MERRITSWFSPNLQMEMPLVAYGQGGQTLLMLPTAAADYLEYERFYLVDAIKPFIEQGRVRAFRNRRVRQQRDVREKHHSFNIFWFSVKQPACQVQSRGSLAAHAECDRSHASNPEIIRIFPFGCGEPSLPDGWIQRK